MADPSARTSIAPIRTRKSIIGANHHFFLSFKNPHISNIVDALDINRILRNLLQIFAIISVRK